MDLTNGFFFVSMHGSDRFYRSDHGGNEVNAKHFN